MNRKVAITVAALAFCAVVGTAAAGWQQPQPTAELAVSEPLTGIKKEDDNVQRPSTAKEEPGYRLQAVEGRLGVFVGESSQAEMVLDVYLNSLPQADRLALQQGIYVDSYQQLVALLEDYIS